MSVDKKVTENGLARYKEDRLLRRAIKEDWHLTDEQKRKIKDRLVDIATDPNQGSRDATRAASVLVTCRKNDNEKLMKVLDKVSADKHEIKNQQINIYLPANGREAITNGQNGSGRN